MSAFLKFAGVLLFVLLVLILIALLLLLIIPFRYSLKGSYQGSQPDAVISFRWLFGFLRIDVKYDTLKKLSGRLDVSGHTMCRIDTAAEDIHENQWEG